jgi:hypothetical protein
MAARFTTVVRSRSDELVTMSMPPAVNSDVSDCPGIRAYELTNDVGALG